MFETGVHTYCPRRCQQCKMISTGYRCKMFSTLFLYVTFAIAHSHSISLKDSEEFKVSRLNFTNFEQRRELHDVPENLHRSNNTSSHFVIDKNGNLWPYSANWKNNTGKEQIVVHESTSDNLNFTLQTFVKRKVGNSNLSPYQRRIAENLPSYYEQMEKKRVGAGNAVERGLQTGRRRA